MKKEKAVGEKLKEVEIKRFDLDAEKDALDYEKDLSIQEAKKLVSQGVAILDFEDSGFSKPKSVTVRRVLDNSIIFYSKDLRDIEKFLNWGLHKHPSPIHCLW